MSFLNHAVIQFSPGVYETKLSPKMGTMVSHIHGVKKLSLSKAFVPYFSLRRPCCKFNNLRFLKLEVGLHEDYMEGLVHILKLTPNLEVLCLLLTPCNYGGPTKPGAWKFKEEDVPCLSNRLQIIEISDFHDEPYPFELVKFFLQNGKSLEKLRILQKKQSLMNPMIVYVMHTIPLASETVSVDVVTVSDTGKARLLQYVYEECEASAGNRTKYLRLKPARRSPRIAALKARGSSSRGSEGWIQELVYMSYMSVYSEMQA
ncbi:hypothetical protein ACS0TY_019714 [Phlomoides rotata]